MKKGDFRNPLDSYCPDMFEQLGPDSKAGRALRQGDARVRLQEIDECEKSVVRQLRNVDAIADKLAQERAAIKMDTQYIMRFGVTTAQRELFRTMLRAVAESGRSSLREVITMVRHVSGDNVVECKQTEPINETDLSYRPAAAWSQFLQ